jgi:hypothetical protein
MQVCGRTTKVIRRRYGLKVRVSYLNASDVLRSVDPCIGPRSVDRFGDADSEIFEDSAEEFEVGQLDGVYSNIFTQFNNDELLNLWGGTWAEHVAILL